MTVDIHSKEGKIIRRLIPLSTIPTDKFESICKNISVKTAKTNTFLFKKNDTENALIYLIQGAISLQSDDLIIESINSGSDSAKFALAHQIPRKIDALTLTPVLFFKLDASILCSPAPVPIPHKQEESSFMVIDEPEDDSNEDNDWLTALLKLPIFRALPPTNLQQIIMNLQEIQFQKGETIIKQGDLGDFYYLIKKGHCLVSRKPSANAKDIKLAQLRPQDTFGEDSLLSGEPRNVSISALTNVSLIRLHKDKFISLIKDPSLNFIKHSEISAELANNNTVLIDVRSPDEYNRQHLPHSINTPFFSLRMYIKSLDKNKSVIIICDNGKTSEAAAFLLLRYKISAQIVEGGMENIPEELLESTATFSIDNNTGPLATTGAVIQHEEPEELSPPEHTSKIAFTQSEPNNDALHLENRQLKQTIQTLKSEKEALEKKYRILFKQTEKLKTVLESLKK